MRAAGSGNAALRFKKKGRALITPGLFVLTK
jgi:hypothetical protein